MADRVTTIDEYRFACRSPFAGFAKKSYAKPLCPLLYNAKC